MSSYAKQKLARSQCEARDFSYVVIVDNGEGLEEDYGHCSDSPERLIRFIAAPHRVWPYCDEHAELVLRGFPGAIEVDF